MSPIDSDVRMLCHQKTALSEKIRIVRRCDFVGRNALLGVGFEVSKVHAKPSVSLSLDPYIVLSYCSSVMPATLLPAMMVMD